MQREKWNRMEDRRETIYESKWEGKWELEKLKIWKLGEENGEISRKLELWKLWNGEVLGKLEVWEMGKI